MALVVSGSTCTFYVNGNLLTTFSSCGFGSIDSSPVLLGYYGGGSGDTQQYVGSEDDVRIYDRALSASEVQYLYNMGK